MILSTEVIGLAKASIKFVNLVHDILYYFCIILWVFARPRAWSARGWRVDARGENRFCEILRTRASSALQIELDIILYLILFENLYMIGKNVCQTWHVLLCTAVCWKLEKSGIFGKWGDTSKSMIFMKCKKNWAFAKNQERSYLKNGTFEKIRGSRNFQKNVNIPQKG